MKLEEEAAEIHQGYVTLKKSLEKELVTCLGTQESVRISERISAESQISLKKSLEIKDCSSLCKNKFQTFFK